MTEQKTVEKGGAKNSFTTILTPLAPEAKSRAENELRLNPPNGSRHYRKFRVNFFFVVFAGGDNCEACPITSISKERKELKTQLIELINSALKLAPAFQTTG